MHFNLELRVSSSFAVNYLTKLYFNPTQILLKQVVGTIIKFAFITNIFYI